VTDQAGKARKSGTAAFHDFVLIHWKKAKPWGTRVEAYLLFMGDKGILMCGCYGNNPTLLPE
jgi:hypothetical protein